MRGEASYRFRGGGGQEFEVVVEWQARRGGAPELVGYTLRSVDGRPIPVEFRRGIERLLDGELVSAAYAQALVAERSEELGAGTLRLTASSGETVEVPVREGRITRRYADPDAAAASIFDEAERRRRRRDVTPELLEDVARIYLEADPTRPTATVAETMHVSSAQASRYVKAAREAGLLPPREA